jgi:hypothetical protein
MGTDVSHVMPILYAAIRSNVLRDYTTVPSDANARIEFPVAVSDLQHRDTGLSHFYHTVPNPLIILA